MIHLALFQSIILTLWKVLRLSQLFAWVGKIMEMTGTSGISVSHLSVTTCLSVLTLFSQGAMGYHRSGTLLRLLALFSSGAFLSCDPSYGTSLRRGHPTDEHRQVLGAVSRIDSAQEWCQMNTITTPSPSPRKVFHWKGSNQQRMKSGRGHAACRWW
jgi:hypothetical protein